ncbi:MAG: hypothetical protein H8D87_14980 [Deltaproteobacteria bacterium]|uniref:hypothetical protein n=1 Tax=Desulfobacula sp. TaxID=2593537 RepID=UPI00198FC167|nr:hypothetical protein [Candidatus Desulfobacula maris]MBL6994883.1 hypothetical protein [Desulfobacula sp.]
MQIPLYQIQNILKLYSRQLGLGSIQNPNNPFDKDFDHMHTTSEGKRQAITDKVISSILNRIITEKPSEKNKKEIASPNKKNLEGKINFLKNKNQFTYTVIDGNNKRTNHTLPVEDSKFIVNRMIELARQVSDN